MPEPRRPEKPEAANVVGRNIRYYRRRAGLTQAQLAQRLGWTSERNPSGGVVSLYENARPGFNNPRLKLLERFAEALGVSVSDLTAEALPEADGALEARAEG